MVFLSHYAKKRSIGMKNSVTNITYISNVPPIAAILEPLARNIYETSPEECVHNDGANKMNEELVWKPYSKSALPPELLSKTSCGSKIGGFELIEEEMAVGRC